MLSYNDLNYNYEGGDLRIDNHLSSLSGCPEHITGDFNVYNDNLTSLIGGPQRVNGDYQCSYNRLTDLVGCASYIAGILNCQHNQITSLVGIHKIIKSCNTIYFNSKLITQGGIGLLLIAELDSISTGRMPFRIIKSYLGTGTKGMMACRDELIKEGYGNYAKL